MWAPSPEKLLPQASSGQYTRRSSRAASSMLLPSKAADRSGMACKATQGYRFMYRH